MPRPTLLALITLFLLAACHEPAEPPPATPRAAIDGTLHLLSFSRLQGYAEGVPCSAADPEPLAAAGAVKRQLTAEGQTAVLALVGDSLIQPGAVTRSRSSVVAAQARARVMLDAMVAAGVDLLVPSHGDLDLLGTDEYLDEAARRGLTVLVSNLEVDGRDDVRDYVVVQNGTLRIALLAAIAPQTAADQLDDDEEDEQTGPAAPSHVRFYKPWRRLKEISEGIMLRHEADMVAVLSNLSQKLNQKLCEAPDVHFIIGTSDGGVKADLVVRRLNTALMFQEPNGRELAQTTFRVVQGDMNLVDLSPLWSLPRMIESESANIAEWREIYGTSDPHVLAPLVSPGLVDDFLSKWSLHFENIEWVKEYGNYGGSSIAHRGVELVRAPADDPVTAILARQGLAITAAADGLDRPLEELDPASSIPVPDDCISCHPAQYAHWLQTDHAHAYEALREVQRHRDSSCLVCHAAGFGKSEGFLDTRLDAPYGGYTCWNCHGTKVFHAELNRGVVEPAFNPNSNRSTIETNCGGCHSERRSPGFDAKAALETLACPPMRPDEPAIIDAYSKALAAVDRNIDEEPGFTRNLYFRGRALVGLGQLQEGFESIRRFAATNTEVPYQAVEIANYLDEHGDGPGGLEVLREYLGHSASDPTVNIAYVQLLLHASDTRARNPALAASHLGLVAPYDLTSRMDPSELALRKVQVEALYEAGRAEEGYHLLAFLASNFKPDDELLALLDRYMGGN